MDTLAQPIEQKTEGNDRTVKLSRKLQVQVTEDAYLRVHHAARVSGVSAGRILSDLLVKHLPAVGVAA